MDGLTIGNETTSNTTAMQGMLYRTLGSTGEKVSAIGIGGSHIGWIRHAKQWERFAR